MSAGLYVVHGKTMPLVAENLPPREARASVARVSEKDIADFGSDRIAFRCFKCSLVQFDTRDGKCRRCKTSLHPEPKKSVEHVCAETKSNLQPFTKLYGSDVEQAVCIALKLVRMGKELSQDELAIKCKFMRTYVSKYENGRTIPLTNTVLRIVDALQISHAAFWHMVEIIAANPPW